jgi:hypothetical protein
MVTGEETARALRSIFRIAIFDREGVEGFGRDARACARSFWAYAIALPATLLLLALPLSDPGIDQPVFAGLCRLVGEVIEIAGFPLLLVPVLAGFGRLAGWSWFVTGYNWLSMAQIIARVTLLGFLWDLPGAEIHAVIGDAASVYFLVLEAFLAEAVLGIGAWRAGFIVLLDIGFSVGVDRIADWIAGLG